MESITVENYLKAIYQLSGTAESGGAATSGLARCLNVTSGSVTLMLQRLAELGLVDYEAYRGVRLTKKGERIALRIVRNHRLIELYLTNTLNLPWDEVHEEAENLEHSVSDRLVDRIDEYLGHPDRDPHGDPIPDATGKFRTREGTPLVKCAPQSRFILLRVPDRSADFLRYLREGGLTVGATAMVLENQPSAGVVTVEVGGRPVSLSREMAASVLVRPV
jgi:DtxR family Mn-dependent transcriptional regulator